MPALVRPRLQILFSDRPRGQITADLLDAQIHNLIEAIHSTQQALDEIRRDDGKLHNGIIDREQLSSSLKHDHANLVAVEKRAVAAAGDTVEAATHALNTLRDIDLRAADAEAAAVSAAQMLSAISHGNVAAKTAEDDAENSADRAESAAIDSENWGNYSQANADNAIAAKNEATQWAEYLAGPVVDPAKAPAYISEHPFGHGLYYQPVEGAPGGLFSAKWWALYASNIVGNVGMYYLGAWPSPPLPGEVNPDTGQMVPSPIKPGSIYFDSETGQMFVWNGSQWIAPAALTAAYTGHHVYTATAGQITFSGADDNGNTPTVNGAPSQVHVNGVLLVPNDDYTVAGNVLTLDFPATVNSIVQWDVMVSPDAFGAHINAYKVTIAPAPDGTLQDFTLTYTDPVDGVQPTSVDSGAQLQVSLDGCIQEPGAAYTASGADLHFSEPPHPTAGLWAVWYQPGALP